jgi:hypothetical protein
MASSFSNNITLHPSRAEEYAEDSPAGPPPTTAISYSGNMEIHMKGYLFTAISLSCTRTGLTKEREGIRSFVCESLG